MQVLDDLDGLRAQDWDRLLALTASDRANASGTDGDSNSTGADSSGTGLLRSAILAVQLD